MIKRFIPFLIILTVFAGCASFKKKPGKKDIAFEQIKSLKNGVLLVRLFTKEHAVEAAAKAGNLQLAEQIRARQEATNKRIIRAFRDHYNFSPVYFFFSGESRKITEGNLSGLVLLNDSLEADHTLKPDLSSFFVAEFGFIEQSADQKFSGYILEKGEDGVERVPVYHGGPNQAFHALVLRDNQLNQLNRPFPYYIKTWDQTNYEISIEKLNARLQRFYSKSLIDLN